MNISFGAEFRPDLKSLYQKGDSEALRETIKLNLEYAERFANHPLINEILGDDVFVLKRRKGKSFYATLTQYNAQGEKVFETFYGLVNREDFAKRSKFAFANMLATFACIKTSIVNKYPHTHSWLLKILTYLKETKIK